MCRKVFVLYCLATLAWMGAFTHPAVAQSDQIYVSKTPAPLRGTILEIGKDQVMIAVSGVNRTIPVNEIARITFADEPSELNNARNASLTGKWGVADGELKKLNPAEVTREAIKQDVDYYKALVLAKLALTEGGDKAAASTAMLNFAKTAPGSFHFYDAAEILGDLAVASGDFAGAVRFYGSIEKAPWSDYQVKAALAVGRALVAQGQFDAALQKFDAASGIDLPGPEGNQLKLMATAGKAQCLAETGKPDEGIALLQDIIAKNDPQDVALFARTYNALGNCYLKAGKTKDALQAFLFTDILFNAESDAHAEALYRLSKLWGDVNKKERAVAARAALQQQYGGSYWAGLKN